MHKFVLNRCGVSGIQGSCHGGNGHGGNDDDPGRNWRSDEHFSKKHEKDKRKFKTKKQLEEQILSWVSC